VKTILFSLLIFTALITVTTPSCGTEKHFSDNQKVFVQTGQNHHPFSYGLNPYILALEIASILIAVFFLWSYTLHRKVAKKTAGLKKSEEKYRLLIESACEGIILINPDGTIAEVNSKACEITGYSYNEIIGKQFVPFFKKDDLERFPLRYDLLKNGKSVIFTRNVIRKDGTEVPIESITRMMPGNTLLVFCRDVTERLKMEECIRNSEKLESLGILAGGIAHDFNNMLSGLFGYIHLSKELVEKDSQVDNYLTSALSIHHRAAELTNQILTFSKGGAPDKKPVNLRSVISNAISNTLKSTNINVTISNESEYICNVDENQINQVFKNLLVNSREAMKNAGDIFIEIKETLIENHTILNDGKYCKIIITDHGCGIPSDVIHSIFDPFFTTKPGSTGLGLTIAYSILKRHGGHIETYSEDGKGASFTIYLPMQDAAANMNVIVQVQNPAGNKNEEKILIMDDDLHARNITQILLNSLNYEVISVSNGDSAVREFSDAFHSGKPFDLVILDLTIAGGYGGKEVIKILKEIDPSVGSIALSGYSNDPVMANPKAFHFSSRLKKPFLKEELSSVVFDVLKNKNN
jgi:PAS domain S-box-containing protein